MRKVKQNNIKINAPAKKIVAVHKIISSGCAYCTPLLLCLSDNVLPFGFPYKKPPAVDISILLKEVFYFNVRFGGFSSLSQPTISALNP
jgi:hypothetical protein